jgi:eukaryotic-like serine/threonine-protein kinase
LNPVPERLAAALADRYRIDREIGAGGMATVYLAEDLRHQRMVAVKVLRPELAAVIGAERFLAEIRTTANLQHPHILALFDSGEADGFLFYVMPYVQGESLRDRLTREKQLPVHDALRIAGEVGSALDYAHRHGVIHRDIKPENILLHDGQALVSDFGIALAVSSASATRMTETGLSLGTPHYMSPEQAMGEREITARSDIYALGAVLYEMLTGEPPFTGPTAQAIVARVLTEKPPAIVARRERVPQHVEDAVLTALEKLPADRFATIAELTSALSGEAAPAYRRAASSSAAAGASHWRRIALGAGGVAVFATLLAITGWLRAPQPSDERVIRFRIQIPAPGPDLTTRIALSPDGRTVAYADYSPGERGGIYLRPLHRAEATHVPGTAGARTVAFSPDGSALAFVAASGAGGRGEMRIVPIAGGAPTTVARNVEWFEGNDWGADGFIYFISRDSLVVSRVPATGGAVEHVGTTEDSPLPAGYRRHKHPHLTPNRRGVLFTVYRGEGVEDDIGVVDLRTRETRLIAKGAYVVGVLGDHLLFVTTEGTLCAVRFDERDLTVSGAAVPLLPNLSVSEGAAQVALSGDGTLAYVNATPPESELVWVGMDGVETPVDPSLRRAFDALAISPDGSRIAFSSPEADGTSNIWLYDVAQHTIARFTDDGAVNFRPKWSPDGVSIVYAADRNDERRARSLWIRRADAADTAHILVRSHRHAQEVSWPRQSGPIIFRDGYDDGGTLRDLRYRMPGSDTTSRVFLASNADEHNPALSPDGRWLAYVSLESGRDEVYVSPFPGPGPRTIVSNGGGTGPIWARSGRQLFYRAADGSMIALELTGSASFSIARRRVLFSATPYLDSRNHAPYDIAPDDSRFLFIRTPPSEGLEVVSNWAAEVLPRLRERR